MTKLTLEQFMHYSSLLVLGILYMNFIGVCVFSITCGSYIPTLSYLATFRTHDVIVVLALTLFAFTLLPVFISFHIKTYGALTIDEVVFMILLEITIFVLTIMEGLIDESNGIEFNPVDNLHHFLSITLCIMAIIWVYYALNFIEITERSGGEKDKLYICWTIYKVGVVFAFLTLYEWHFGYTIYNNILTNPFVESLCEWTLITITIRFPVLLSKTLNYSIKFSSKDKN